MNTKCTIGCGDTVQIQSEDKINHSTALHVIIDGDRVVITRVDTGDIVTMTSSSVTVNRSNKLNIGE